MVRNNQYWGCGDFYDIEMDENIGCGKLSEIKVVVVMMKICAIKVMTCV